MLETAFTKSIEALYSVSFGDILSSNPHENGGVIIFETGRVYGGDSGYYYLGTFETGQDKIKADITVTKHNPSWGNAFGDAAITFKIKVSASINDNIIEGHMTRSDMPQLTLPVRLKKLAALP